MTNDTKQITQSGWKAWMALRGGARAERRSRRAICSRSAIEHSVVLEATLRQIGGGAQEISLRQRVL
jgi:hypothetical protein